MKNQTRIASRVVRRVLFTCLLTASVWSPVGGAIVTRQDISPDPANGNVDAPPTGAFTDRDPAPAKALLQTARENSKRQAATATFALAVAAMEDKDPGAAQILLWEAVQLQPSNPDLLQAAAGLAFALGEFAVAEAYQAKSLELTRAALGAQDIRVAILMDDLGVIYLARHADEQADRTWRESLAIREQALGMMHPSIAPRLNDLAALAMRAGHFDEVERLLKRVLLVLQTNAGTDRAEVAIGQHNLADFYIDRQRPQDAELYYRKALAGWKTIPAQQRLQIAAGLNELGHDYLARQRLAGARAQYELVLRLLTEDVEKDSRHVREARAALDNLQAEPEMRSEREALAQDLPEVPRNVFSRRGQAM